MGYLRSWIWAGLTVLMVVLAVVAVDRGREVVSLRPEHAVEIVLDEGLPYGITEESVAAALDGERIPSWRPLTIRFTTDYTRHQSLVAEDPPAEDVVVSTQTENLEYERPEPGTGGSADAIPDRRFTGAELNPDTFPEQQAGGRDRDVKWDIIRAFERNRDLGHGPTAVVATARTAGELSYDGPPREPTLWFGLAAGAVAAAVLTGLLWARTVRTNSERRRRFRTARSRTARVVLDLEAIEVSLLTVPERQRPAALAEGWERVRGTALSLLRREEALARDLKDQGSGAPADLDAYEKDAAALEAEAQALQSGSLVSGGFAGSGAVLDRVAAQLLGPARRALSRAEDSGVAAQRTAALREAVQWHLGLLETLQEGQQTRQPAWAEVWTQSETDLGRRALELADALRGTDPNLQRRDVSRVVTRRLGDADALAGLRTGLGLPERPAALALDRAIEAEVTARAVAGEPPSAQLEELPAASGKAGIPDDGTRPRLSRPWRIGGAVLAFLVAGATGVSVAEGINTRAPWELQGDQEIGEILIDGLENAPGLQLEAEDIRHYLTAEHVASFDVVVAVRRAEDYLRQDPEEEDTEFERPVVRSSAIDGLRRLRGEFPELMDAGGEELREDAVIIPVVVWEDGLGGVLSPLTGFAFEGTRGRLGGGAYERGSTPVRQLADDGLLAVFLATEIEGVSRGVQAIGTYDPEVDTATLGWVLTLAGTVVLIGAGALAETLAGASLGLRGHGRTGRALRAARGRLEELMVGLDESRLSAVAVLGAGPAGSPEEAGQRLYESALVAAWREAEELAGLPWARQRSASVVARAESLEHRVEDLARQDEDVKARAERFLAESP